MDELEAGTTPEAAGDPPELPVVAVFSGRITLRGSVDAPTISAVEAAIEKELSGRFDVIAKADLSRTDR